MIQGQKIDDPEARATLHDRGMPDHETAVEVPKALLAFASEVTT